MSRHEIPGRNPHHKIAVGWDPPLATFFFQLYDDRKAEDDNPTVWLGAGDPLSFERLKEVIGRYADLTPRMQSRLLDDRKNDR